MEINSDAEPSPRPKSTPLFISTSPNKPHISFQDYDARLDDHKQTYVLTPKVMRTLNVSIFLYRNALAAQLNKGD